VAVQTATSAAFFPVLPGGPASDADLVVAVNENISLSAFGAGLRERINTTVIAASAMASATQATGTATVNNLAFSIGTDQSSLLSITALRVESTSSATTSPLDTTGTATITNLQLTGSVFGPSGTLILSPKQQLALAAGTPNIVVFNQDGLKITLNRQVETVTRNANGTTTLALATDAIAVQFTDFAVGTGFKTGELLIASSSASATAVQPISPQ
jgi:hypothetical protein